jgi:hypothetical protein
MADISLSDNTGVTASLQLRDDSPLGKAKLGQLAAAGASLIADIDKSVADADFKTIDFGVDLKSPAIPAGRAGEVPISGGIKGSLSVIKSVDGPLFADDGFSPVIPVPKDNCWLAFGLNLTVAAKASASIDGFGLGVKGDCASVLTTYYLVLSEGGVFPSLKDSFQQALDNYSLSCTAEAIRMQPAGTVNVADLAGTITFTGSYALPINVNALAGATLPFDYKIALQPSVTLGVTGTIGIAGEFVVRCYKETEQKLTLGIYKKKSTTVEAAFTAGAGLEAQHDSSDLVADFFNAALGGADLNAAGIPPDNAAQLQDALTVCIDRSLSVSMNVECSASTTDEVAAIYSVNLAAGDSAKTDKALSAALKGDWTKLGRLSNVKEIRNIVKTTHESRHAIEINLLGIYNAATLNDFVKSCSILHDGNGQIVVTDRETANHMAVVEAPYTADSDKLRQALAEAFLCTITYTAGATAIPRIATDLSVSQTYFRYAATMSSAQMRAQVLLGSALGLIPAGSWDAELSSKAEFHHVKAGAQARYARNAVLRFFFSDPVNRIARTRPELEKIGRSVMSALIAPADSSAAARRAALQDDVLWNAMDQMGNVAGFGQIESLKRYDIPAQRAIGTDWIDITWWVNAMLKVAPRLSDILTAAESSRGDPTKNRNWQNKRQSLADAIAGVAKNTRAAFADGWGLAVMFSLSAKQAIAEMDLCADGRQEHYGTARPAVLMGRAM